MRACVFVYRTCRQSVRQATDYTIGAPLGRRGGQNARISDVVLGRVLGSGGGELYASSPTIPGRRGSVGRGRGDRETRLKFDRHVVGPVSM